MEQIEMYHQECRDRLSRQDSLAREFSVKALGILTFGATVFGVGTSFLGAGTKLDPFGLTLIIAIGVSLLAMIIFAANILVADKWSDPSDVSSMQQDLRKFSDRKFMEGYADTYVKAIGANQRKLQETAYSINWLIVAGMIELLFFIMFRCYLFHLSL